MREASADRPAIADRQMRHMRHGGTQHGQVRSDNRRCFKLVMARQRADPDRIPLLLYIGEPRNPVDVDQN